MGLRRAVGTIGAVVLVALVAAPVQAERTTGWAAWEPLTGTANAYTTTVRPVGLGFPSATVRSDSRAGAVGVQSGDSIFLNAATPVGQKYGPSVGRPYLNLRPKADRADAPSVTTYTFERPTPPTGWALVLGDVDADQVRVDAVTPDGAALTPTQLNFKDSDSDGAFNLCEFGTPRPGSCSAGVGDAPTWDAGTQTLTGNPAAADTVGATGWFEPTVPVAALRLTFTRRAGFPVFQTWLASVNRTLSGTVSDVSATAPGCDLANVRVRLLAPDGTDLGTAAVSPSGAYSFGQVATQPGYRVSVETTDDPPTCAVVGPRERTVSTAGADATADFDVRRIVPQPVSGRVVAGGQGLGGVTVRITPPGGGPATTTVTADDGTYLFDENAVGTGYVVSIDVPAGYDGDDENPPFDVGTSPVTGQDFTLTERPSITGTVTGGGGPLGGVPVTLTPTAGPPVGTVTGPDGTYAFDRLPAGTYSVAVTPPDGYDPEPSRAGVAVTGSDVTGQDFALTRPGSVGGRVTDEDGAGVAGVDVRVDGPGSPTTVTTDAEGGYYLGGLDAGAYSIEPVAPSGQDVRAPASRTTTVTSAGETRGGRDFVLVAEPDEPTPPTTEPSTTDPTTAPGSDDGSDEDGEPAGASGALPDTGGPSRLVGVAGVGLVLAGAATIGAGRRRRDG